MATRAAAKAKFIARRLRLSDAERDQVEASELAASKKVSDEWRDAYMSLKPIYELGGASEVARAAGGILYESAGPVFEARLAELFKQPDPSLEKIMATVKTFTRPNHNLIGASANILRYLREEAASAAPAAQPQAAAPAAQPQAEAPAAQPQEAMPEISAASPEPRETPAKASAAERAAQSHVRTPA